MAPVQFRILAAVIEQAGYTCELLENCGSQVSPLVQNRGGEFVHQAGNGILRHHRRAEAGNQGRLRSLFAALDEKE